VFIATQIDKRKIRV